MSYAPFLPAFLLILFLGLLSVVESAVNQLSRLALKVLAEKNPSSRYDLLHKMAEDRRGFLLPIQFANQLILVLLTVLATELLLSGGISYPMLSAVCVMGIVVASVRQLLPYLLTHNKGEQVLLRLVPYFRFFYAVLSGTAWPILASFRWIRADALSRTGPVEEDEATDEEIQAYLGVGEEEGIFESEESELIQSALEFGNTLVREIMTPRSEITAIEERASLNELRELVVSSKHSRIPVYRERLDHIVGMVYVRNLLAYLNGGDDKKPISPIVNEVLIVPETKRVYDLMKEMQAKAEQLAVVVNEYGTVSGLVTIEDLIEEIVGDIRDEDEFHRIDLVYEGDGNYIVRGGVEIGALEEALDVRFGEHEAATVSGLVVDHLGAVPVQGEAVQIEPVEIQVLSADRKRIHTMRVRRLDYSPPDHPEPPL